MVSFSQVSPPEPCPPLSPPPPHTRHIIDFYCAWLLKKIRNRIWFFCKHKIRFTLQALCYTSGRVATFPGQVETSNRMSLLNSISHAKFVSDFGFRLLFVLYNRNWKVNGFKHHTLKGTVTPGTHHFLFHSNVVMYCILIGPMIGDTVLCQLSVSWNDEAK